MHQLTKTIKVPCTIMRGGTSKGIFFMESDLPPAGSDRDLFLLKALGSPDRRQIDGLGGADPLTSKVAIISLSERPDADINYTFAQVDIEHALVGYSGNCGNITAAVGLFAVQEGLANITEPFATVRVFNANTKKVLKIFVPCCNGAPEEEGTYMIDGVPGYSPRIDIDFSLTTGSVTGKLLPTGNVVDFIDIPDLGKIECSIVDIANPCVFMKADVLGLSGRESPDDLETMTDIKNSLEQIRIAAGKMVGIPKNPGLPMLAFVSAPGDQGETYHLISRLMFMGVMHEAYSGTAAVCTAAAAKVIGTVPYSCTRPGEREISIGHPLGGIEVDIIVDTGKKIVERASMGRTARRIMDGEVFVRV